MSSAGLMVKVTMGRAVVDSGGVTDAMFTTVCRRCRAQGVAQDHDLLPSVRESTLGGGFVHSELIYW